MREAITESEGQEVLFVVKNNEEGIGIEVTVAANGSDSAAPAIYPFMEKGDAVVHNHPSGVLRPSGNDLAVASRLGNQGIGFYIVNNKVTKLYSVCDPVSPGRVKDLDAEELCGILLPGGVLSREFDHYEVRDSQVEMLEDVIEAFNGEKILAVEAGTGVGKSFAYLIPALKWAQENRERVVISTATINLQQQLIDKDIPIIKRITGSKVKAVLVKGRGNFVCLRRLEEARRQTELFSDTADEIERIYQWSETTSSGSRSDLSFVPDPGVWSRVCSESDACMGMKCPKRERCFVLKMKKNASDANVLVVNHHILFSDLAMRANGAGYNATAVLPPFNRLIFDEAHTIEKSATSFFSENYNKFTLYRNLNLLYGKKGRKSFGILEKIKPLLPESSVVNAVPFLANTVREKAETVEHLSGSFLAEEYSKRIMDLDNTPELENLLVSMYELQKELLRLIETIRDFSEDLFAEVDDNPDIFELRVVLQRLQKLCGIIGSFKKHSEKTDHIFWVEKKKTGKNEYFYSFSITPLDISDMMKSAVYETQSTIVLTSATLTIGKKFDFWKKRTGLSVVEGDRVAFKRLKSPFEYKKQVLLGIPDDAPDPSGDSFQPFISKSVKDIIDVAGGKTLVLFTSYGMLRNTYDDVRPALDEMGITILKQGEKDRARLLETFNFDVSSVLFATDSFWEGVDIPGESLKVVIICRLPFKVPTDPIVKARMERIEMSGGNPFYELSIPEAAMRLQQGFGRLMRRKSDHGVVVILDPRIIKKSYGKLLISSLPETARSIKKSSSMLLDLENFLYT